VRRKTRLRRLERAELLQVFQREDIERLICHHCPDDERNQNSQPKVFRDPRVADLVKNRHPAELGARDPRRPMRRASSADETPGCAFTNTNDICDRCRPM
jgi:hypothetical protein